MSEAEYLRNVIVACFSALGMLGGAVVMLAVWIYKGDQGKMRERFSQYSQEAKTARDSLSAKIDERDLAFGRHLDAQASVLEEIREVQSEGRTLFHQHDKRIDRLERDNMRRGDA